ncbi:hypothetical protein B0H11DRAFT_1907059 [Mycena galericulata]|nr:hypothetical protein B0H11DRAFT_1907059 [Mycena galericulata]
MSREKGGCQEEEKRHPLRNLDVRPKANVIDDWQSPPRGNPSKWPSPTIEIYEVFGTAARKRGEIHDITPFLRTYETEITQITASTVKEAFREIRWARKRAKRPQTGQRPSHTICVTRWETDQENDDECGTRDKRLTDAHKTIAAEWEGQYNSCANAGPGGRDTREILGSTAIKKSMGSRSGPIAEFRRLYQNTEQQARSTATRTPTKRGWNSTVKKKRKKCTHRIPVAPKATSRVNGNVKRPFLIAVANTAHSLAAGYRRLDGREYEKKEEEIIIIDSAAATNDERGSKRTEEEYEDAPEVDVRTWREHSDLTDLAKRILKT